MIDQVLETTDDVSQPITTPFTDVTVKTDGTFVVTVNGNRSHVTQDYNPPLYQAVRQYLDNGGLSSEYAEDIVVQSDPGLLAKLWIEASLKASDKLVSEYRDARDLGGVLPITAEQFTQLLTWRQAVREWPLVSGYPDKATQPATPDWIEAVVLDGE
ncbi:hypothetical protein ACDH60_12800 [Pseudomonas ficuserectae]|uniref:Tail assembly chaperone n=2 Tax=Pseudomonas amygdali pv. lachrymans TaxID=53707 RepID=A0ABR5KQ81_PSEAV|nr:hypothetical protein [Pseudomonas amygdali]ARA80081.1 hypothetical protein B5U27_08365 [Pseudomonas amygdali pv. lachrymans]AXH56919.1 hypothetical protein PLA107_017680 [Pseudomonas amygdali pv. lachrymans str. M301315]KKY58588.1 hypothetical protein AAY85_07960 [Pseudomonas amygdali pv. lachrymans]KPB98786.1 Uncharacterized protein AC501_3769 [Pseudomonas amygdali pv. lachrymans]KPC16745.1 Uncharacterized protein AC499_6623 [Pseudomonas amygdali pv. lachrymans]